MSKLLQLRGGTTSEHSSFTGALREVTVDTTKDTLVVHDGSTAGGFAMPSSVDKTKLDAIEASATADQTDAEIRAAVEAATDSNVFTDADHSKLNAIEASATADQSDAEIKTAVESATSIALGGSPTTTTQSASDNSTKVATTAYADAAIAALADSAPATLNTLNELAAALGDDANYATTTASAIGTKMPLAGGAFTGAVTTNSTIDGRDVAADGVTADAALPKAGGAMTGAITTNSTFDGVDIATRDGILSSTTTTAGAALPKAGGAMTGAITTNSTFDGRDVAADGVTADAALPKTGGAMTGAITTNSTFDGVDIATRDGILSSTTTTAGAALPKAGGTMSGLVNMADQIVQRPVLKDYAETKVAMAANDVDLSLGNVQTKTISGAQTLTFSNPPASGSAGSFTLILTNGGSATVTWPASVDWPAATAPTLTASGVDVLVFTTIDGGTIWYGVASGIGMA